MSENYRYYRAKTAQRPGRSTVTLQMQRNLDELFETIRRCEAAWALEDRIEKSR